MVALLAALVVLIALSPVLPGHHRAAAPFEAPASARAVALERGHPLGPWWPWVPVVRVGGGQ